MDIVKTIFVAIGTVLAIIGIMGMPAAVSEGKGTQFMIYLAMFIVGIYILGKKLKE